MTTTHRFLLLLLAWLLPAAGPKAQWEPDPSSQSTMVGLFVGNDDGGEGLEPLRYAHRDARKLAEVLAELGGMPRQQLQIVLGGRADEVLAAMRATAERVRQARAAGQRVMLVFYYSGHAKDGALRLGQTRLPLAELRAWLERASAEVRVAFLDACQSGAITRIKGGALAPSMVELEHTQGQVIITSSSASEAAQESDELGGSFFTHFLVSGLRGAADRSEDGAVSLREIYEYAYHQTVLRTALTRGGIQHPTYGFELAGRGEIVMTRTRHHRSGLLFAGDLQGDYLIYDPAKRALAAELSKSAGASSFLALPPGRYLVKKRRSQDLLVGEVRIGADQQLALQEQALRPTAFEDDQTKGIAGVAGKGLELAALVRFGAEAFFDTPTRENLFTSAPQVGLELLLHHFPARAWSLGLDVLFAGGADDTRLTPQAGPPERVPVDFFRLEVGAGIQYRRQWPWVALYTGPHFTLFWARRTFGGSYAGWPAQTLGTFCPGWVLGTAIALGRFELSLEARSHYLYYQLSDEPGSQSLGYGGAYLGVAYRR